MLDVIERVNIKNRVFALPTRMVHLLDFDTKKVEIYREGDDEIGIYYVRYDGGPFYLTIDDLSGYFERSSQDDHKYLNLICCNKEQGVIYDKYVSVWEEIKKAINEVANNKFSKYNRDYSMIRFESDDILPLDETIGIESVVIVIRSVLSKDGGYYPQFVLDDLLHKV